MKKDINFCSMFQLRMIIFSVCHIFSEKSKTKVLENTDCLVTKTGSVSCIAEGYDDAKCHTDILAWPYDTMNCNLQYTSGVYNASQVSHYLYSFLYNYIIT